MFINSQQRTIIFDSLSYKQAVKFPIVWVTKQIYDIYYSVIIQTKFTVKIGSIRRMFTTVKI